MIKIHLSKDKTTGDYRLAAIHLLALLRGKAPPNVTLLYSGNIRNYVCRWRHASKQYDEPVCLKSCNAEHEERLFDQGKWIAENTTNRKPENILPNVLLRLQAKSVTTFAQCTKTKPMPLARTQEQSVLQKILSLRLHLSVNDSIAGKHIWRK